MENRKKVVANSLKSALKRKNKVEEGGVLGSGMKKEQGSINVKAKKMMKGRVEPSTVLIVLRVVPIVV
jgi:hypothetical protein